MARELQNELSQQTCFPVEISIINKALSQFEGYLSRNFGCPRLNVGIFPSSGVVFDNGELAKCVDEMGENLGDALTTPKYGVWDICDSAQKYHGCLKSLFSKARSTKEKFIMMTMHQSFMDIEKFVNGTCAALSKYSFFACNYSIRFPDFWLVNAYSHLFALWHSKNAYYLLNLKCTK